MVPASNLLFPPAMSSIATSAPVTTRATYSDTWAGKRLSEMDERVERSMALALSSEVITDNQRAAAWEAFHQAGWVKKMEMSRKVGQYVRDVLAGKRQPRPDVAPAVPVQQPVAPALEEPVLMRVVRDEPAEVVAEVAPEVVQAQPAEQVAAEVAEVPMWIATPSREALPAGLKWSGRQLPAVAQTVRVMRRGRARQAKVVGYFHAEGVLGIEVEFEGRVPNVLRTSPRSHCFFGSEVRSEAVAA